MCSAVPSSFAVKGASFNNETEPADAVRLLPLKPSQVISHQFVSDTIVQHFYATKFLMISFFLLTFLPTGYHSQQFTEAIQVCWIGE